MPKCVILTSITMAQVHNLMNIFAYLTPAGWVIPDWLLDLHEVVLTTESHNV